MNSIRRLLRKLQILQAIQKEPKLPRCHLCWVVVDWNSDPVFCPDHCPCHDYEYNPMERLSRCKTCGIEKPPYDPF